MKHARVVYQGKSHEAQLRDAEIVLDSGMCVAEHELTWLPPVEAGTIFALGLNYVDHASELRLDKPSYPLVFLKTASALTGHRQKTIRPAGVRSMHFECELAVVIGKEGRNILRKNARSHIAGYTVANDYTIRDYLENYYRPNLRVKNRDASTPIGPWLVDDSDIEDPQRLEICTTVNGTAVQSGNTSDMIFDIGSIVEYLSEFATLSPGDVILTGTPSGVRNCEAGDEVVTEILGVGRLVNTLVSAGSVPNEE